MRKPDAMSAGSRAGIEGLFLSLAVVAGGAMVGSCAGVDPQPDFEHLSGEIRAATGEQPGYRPERDQAAIEEATVALLQDGLSAGEAVQVALLRNPLLQSLFARMGVARAEVVAAGLPHNPTFTLTPRFPSGGGRSNVTYAFSQNIFDLFLAPLRRRAAEARLADTQRRAAAEAARLVALVRKSCFRLMGLQRALGIAARGEDLARRSLQLAQDRLGAGGADQVDVDLARSNLLDVRQQQLALRRDREEEQAVLQGLLGLAASAAEVNVLDELPAPPRELPADEVLVARAQSRRLDVQAAALAVTAAEAELRLEQRRAYPGVSAGAEYERAETDPSLGGPSLEFTLPLWHHNQARIAGAAYRVEQRRKELDQARETAAAEVRAAAARLRGSGALARFHEEEALPLARRAVESAQRAYRSGRRDILVLLQGQKELLDRQRSHAEALVDYASAIADLELALDSPLRDVLDGASSQGPAGDAAHGPAAPP